MIVVDTSVWIDFFAGAREPHVQELDRLIHEDVGIALTDVVLTEILQGVRSERDAERVEERLAPFDLLRLDSVDDFRRAAELYRAARRRGITIRRTLDCLIASVCVRDAATIHHNDSDFARLAGCSALTVHQY